MQPKDIRSLVPTNITPDNLPSPTEQEQLKAQMELLLERIGKVAQLIIHPAFDRFKKPNGSEGKNMYWDLAIAPDEEGHLVCLLGDMRDYQTNHRLSISNEGDNVGFTLFIGSPIEQSNFDFSRNAPLKDPVTHEGIQSVDVQFDTNAQEPNWLKRLFQPYWMSSRRIGVEVRTLAYIPEFKPLTYDPETVEPTTQRIYLCTHKATTDIRDRRLRVFERETYIEQEDPYRQFGFPLNQTFNMSDDEALSRVDATIAFIMPALQAEIESYTQQQELPHGTIQRRLE